MVKIKSDITLVFVNVPNDSIFLKFVQLEMFCRTLNYDVILKEKFSSVFQNLWRSFILYGWLCTDLQKISFGLLSCLSVSQENIAL